MVRSAHRLLLDASSGRQLGFGGYADGELRNAANAAGQEQISAAVLAALRQVDPIVGLFARESQGGNICLLSYLAVFMLTLIGTFTTRL